MVEGQHPVIQTVFDEQLQSHSTRNNPFEKLETLLQRPVVSFFTSFRHVAPIHDADMLEGVLQRLGQGRGLVLLVSSPGGDGLSVERIINICRAYSPIVPT